MTARARPWSPGQLDILDTLSRASALSTPAVADDVGKAVHHTYEMLCRLEGLRVVVNAGTVGTGGRPIVWEISELGRHELRYACLLGGVPGAKPGPRAQLTPDSLAVLLTMRDLGGTARAHEIAASTTIVPSWVSHWLVALEQPGLVRYTRAGQYRVTDLGGALVRLRGAA